MLVMKRKVIFITCLSLCLSSFQIISNQPAMAAVCQGPAAYPPDLPDCLDPVVAAQQEAAAKAAADAAAAVAAARAAQDLAIKTNTGIVVAVDGKNVELTAAELIKLRDQEAQ